MAREQVAACASRGPRRLSLEVRRHACPRGRELGECSPEFLVALLGGKLRATQGFVAVEIRFLSHHENSMSIGWKWFHAWSLPRAAGCLRTVTWCVNGINAPLGSVTRPDVHPVGRWRVLCRGGETKHRRNSYG